MTGWAIVAIPREDESVWKYSSEKIPHLTLLYLGEQDENTDVKTMVEFIEHVCKTSLYPFYMEVDHRGVLGDESADVLFFRQDKYSMRVPSAARDVLLANNTIRAAYDSVEQYPEWTPHLTMGYPSKPAKKDDRDYGGFHGVQFDRIALWTGEFEGPTYRLEYPENEMETSMAMSDELRDHLMHYGVKGMRWGVRRTASQLAERGREFNEKRLDKSPVEVQTIVKPGRKVAAVGGKNQPASKDAIEVAAARQKAKASTTDALSTEELQKLVTRMNLEQQYSKLSVQNKTGVDKFLSDIFEKTAKQEGQKLANEYAGKMVATVMKKVVKTGVAVAL